MSPRRRTTNITGIRGTGQVDYREVWRVFECYHPGCDALLKISETQMQQLMEGGQPITLECPKCDTINDSAVIGRAQRWKYCRVCEWLQPLDNFHKHRVTSAAFRSGRQFECSVCKNTVINPHLNPLRTADQHREAAQRRRLNGLVSGDTGRIDSRSIFERFEGRCFNCDRSLEFGSQGDLPYVLDHTLPARYLWPLTTESATLLCTQCNNAKHDQWPSTFYTDDRKLRRLSVLTGLPHRLLSGLPRLNPSAVARLRANVDEFLSQWIRYPDEIQRIRGMILDMTGIDIYDEARHVPGFLRDPG